MMLFVLVFCVLSVYGVVLEEGDYCEKNGVSGFCKNIKKCPSAIEGIKRKEYPQTCSFMGYDPVVCCSDSSAKAPSTKRTTSVTPDGIGDSFIDYANPPLNADEYGPISSSVTAEKTGQKAWDKCIKHQLTFSGKKNAFSKGYSRQNLCIHNVDQLIIGLSRALVHEFPHMALLGYKDSGNITWDQRCAGALISERFVLTSAHCAITKAGVAVSHVQLSSQRANNVHVVLKVVQNPSFDSKSLYHDIALLELDTPVQLDEFTVPACLVEGVGERAFLTGWTEDSQALHKSRVSKLSTRDCNSEYPASQRLPNGGVDEGGQACYKDGDSLRLQEIRGGILQTHNKIACMYTVVGVSNFGPNSSENIGLYTMVAAYLPWIESVVWPEHGTPHS